MHRAPVFARSGNIADFSASVFSLGDARSKVFDAVSKALSEGGFVLKRSDADRGELEATRDDSLSSSGESEYAYFFSKTASIYTGIIA